MPRLKSYADQNGVAEKQFKGRFSGLFRPLKATEWGVIRLSLMPLYVVAEIFHKSVIFFADILNGFLQKYS